jgi:hypothetical protein
MAVDRDLDLAPASVLPVLARLALASDELAALSRQGFVHSELRGARRVYRLRFRVDGKQRVRCVRAEDATALTRELAVLQRPTGAKRRITSLARRARAALRERRSLLAPVLAAHGYHYHGYTIRRRRRKQPGT